MEFNLIEIEYIKHFCGKAEIELTNQNKKSIEAKIKYKYGKINKKSFIIKIQFQKNNNIIMCEIFHIFSDGTKITTRYFDTQNNAEKFNNKIMQVALKTQAFYILERKEKK